MAKSGCKLARKATPTTDNDTDGHNGAGEFSCSFCDAIIDDDKEIHCKTCRYFHLICANISDNVFEVLHPMLLSFSWVCQEY